MSTESPHFTEVGCAGIRHHTDMPALDTEHPSLIIKHNHCMSCVQAHASPTTHPPPDAAVGITAVVEQRSRRKQP
jgi:hypothetical protein